MAKIKDSFTLTDVQITLAGNIVGGCQSVSVSYEQDNKPIHEAGSKYAREILDGIVTVSGTVEQLFLDKDTIKDLVDLDEGHNPSFDIIGTTINKDPGITISVIGAKFKGFTLDLGLSDETKVSRDFDAIRIKMQ